MEKQEHLNTWIFIKFFNYLLNRGSNPKNAKVLRMQCKMELPYTHQIYLLLLMALQYLVSVLTVRYNTIKCVFPDK